ncbi:MAG: hypothetical protein JWQ79_3515 [Mucilaginibacter sp.]|nr:hypothetical protein [Mucilaginibacter sp.]
MKEMLTKEQMKKISGWYSNPYYGGSTLHCYSIDNPDAECTFQFPDNACGSDPDYDYLCGSCSGFVGSYNCTTP